MLKTAFGLVSIFVLVVLLSILSFNQTSPRDGDTANGNSTSSDQCACDASSRIQNGRLSSVAAAFGLHGNVSDCCCSFATIERENIVKVYPLLQRVASTPFFSHWKIDLCSDCGLWKDQPLCRLRDCSVCECERPPEWARRVTWMPEDAVARPEQEEQEDEGDCGHLDDGVIAVDSYAGESWMTPASSTPAFFGEASTRTDGDGDAAVVVDLRLNPERYTAYGGQSAHKGLIRKVAFCLFLSAIQLPTSFRIRLSMPSVESHTPRQLFPAEGQRW